VALQEPVPRQIAFDPHMAGDEKIEPFPPGKALDIARGRVRFGADEQTKPVSNGDQEVTFTFKLRAGNTELQTWFATSDGEWFGAYYAYIDRLGP
jgi:hypothetical protein